MSDTTTRTKTALAAAAVFALGGAAWTADAAPSPVLITTQDVSAPVGGSALVSFDFDFGAGYTFDGIELHLNFDTTQLALDLANSTASYHGASVDPSTALGAVGSFSANPSDPNGFSAVWFALDSNFMALPSVTATGLATLSYAFHLLPAVQAGQSLPVALQIYAGLADPSGVIMLSDSFGATAHVNATAVPLPAAWVLALGASGLLFGTTKQRSDRRRFTPGA